MSVLTQPADMAPLTREAVAERLKGTKVDVANTALQVGHARLAGRHPGHRSCS